MFVAASDYPPILGWEQMSYVINVLDVVPLSYPVVLGIESSKYSFAQKYPVVVLLEAHVVYAPCIDREYLPIRFYFQFQLCPQVKTY